MERTLIYGILLFASVYILKLNIAKLSGKGIFLKLAVFFGILTLLFLTIGGISRDFEVIPIVTFFIMIILLCVNLVLYLSKIFSGILELSMGLSVLAVVVCEISLRIDPYGRLFYLIFNRIIDIKKIEILSIILFIVLLSVKIFGAIFLNKDLNILNKDAFEVKDGKK